MTQLSFPWSCTPVGDGGPTSFTVEVVEAINRLYGNISPTDSGVIWWKDTAVFPGFTNPIGGTPDINFFLNAINPVGSQIRIRPGAAVVQGWVFINDTDVLFNVSGGNANAVDIIGLRRDVAAQTVRLFHGQGAAASTYSLVQTAATWEIPLVEVQLDGSGDYSSHTDVRKFAATPLYPVQAATYLVHPTIGSDSLWNTGSTPPTPGGYTAATYRHIKPDGDVNNLFYEGFSAGVELFADPITVWEYFQVPYDLVGNELIFEFMIYERVAGTGQMYGKLGYVRESNPNVIVTGAFANWPAMSNNFITANWFNIYGTTVPCTPGEQIQFFMYREGSNGSDTYTGVAAVVSSLRVHYNKATAPIWHTDLPMQ